MNSVVLTNCVLVGSFVMTQHIVYDLSTRVHCKHRLRFCIAAGVLTNLDVA